MKFETLRLMAQDYADRHKEPPPLPAIIDTMAYAYQRICQGEDPWTALGDFSNAWYSYAKHTSVKSPHQRLLGATSFAVTGSIKINTRCTNGFRKPSSRA